MFSRAELNDLVWLTIWVSGGGPAAAATGGGAVVLAGVAVLGFCCGVGVAFGLSFGGVTVISGRVVWPRAQLIAACSASAEAAKNTRTTRGRIVASSDADKTR